MFRLFPALVLTLATTSVFAGENCTCRYKESDVKEGETICMNTPNGSQMATCSRVLNNTSWKFLGTPCPISRNDKPANATEFEPETVKQLLALRNEFI